LGERKDFREVGTPRTVLGETVGGSKKKLRGRLRKLQCPLRVDWKRDESCYPDKAPRSKSILGSAGPSRKFRKGKKLRNLNSRTRIRMGSPR